MDNRNGYDTVSNDVMNTSVNTEVFTVIEPEQAHAIIATEYDGIAADTLASKFDLPKVVVYARIRSTFDAAHAMAAEGASAGTLVLADTQTAGRGRNGRQWSSPPGQGIWLTLIERPMDRTALDVLSLRIGLALAEVLDPFAETPVRLKWPNDLYVGDNKLAGILVEARWRDERVEWVAIGLGVNMIAPPDQPQAAGLRAGIRRAEVITAMLPALRAAASATGCLTAAELEAYHRRDLARGRRCLQPLQGRVKGITPSGELLVELADSLICARSGSLVLE